jgi:hypothetical protein
MRRIAAIAGIASGLVALGLVASPAHAETFYELGRIDGEIYALDAAITLTADGHKAATYYYIPGSHAPEQIRMQVDCGAKRVRTESRRVVRSDLSLVREVSGPGEWTKPEARAIGGILIKAVCEAPSPAGLKRVEAASTIDYVSQSSNEVLSKLDPSKRMIIIDQTSVANCIFARMPKKVKEEAMRAVMDGKPPMSVSGFSEQASKLGAACSGRPESKSDSLIVGAAMGIFERYGVMSLLGDGAKIGEQHLAAAWNTAASEVREPLLKRAGMLHDPGVTVADIGQVDPEPAKRSIETLMNAPVLKPRLDMLNQWNNEQKRVLVGRYFNAVAMGEAAEARMRRAY